MRDGLVRILSAMFLALAAGCGDGPGPPAGRGAPAPPAAPEIPAEPLSAGALSGDGDSASPPPAEPAAVVPPAAPSPPPAAAPAGFSQKVVARARREVASKGGYDPKYYGIPYPGGDVPGPGVCTDLVIRALRAGGVDLQKLIHEDRRADLKAYPRLWEPHALDSSIDHRRVANLMCFLQRKGCWLKVPTAAAAAAWQAGDLVFWELSPGGRLHCGVVSDRAGRSGRPTVIHNLSGAAEEDCLTKWKIIGHARWADAGGSAQPTVPPRAAERTKPYTFENDPEAKG